MDKPIVQLHNVTKKYWLGKIEINALDVPSLEIERGAFIAFMGPSGSGKTTLLNIIGGLDTPTTGDVIIDGVNIARMRERDLAKFRRERMGFIFQFFNLIPTLTALENVELPMILQGNLPRKDIHERAKNLLELVGLGDRLHHKPMELSGGQQQRVAIARALANDPALILADEPTGNVDSATGMKIIQLMGWLNKTRGQTFIIVTHDPKVAAFAQKVLYIIDGKISHSPLASSPKLSSEVFVKDRMRFFLSELESIRNSVKRLKEMKDELPPQVYSQKLSFYENRLQRLMKLIEDSRRS